MTANSFGSRATLAVGGSSTRSTGSTPSTARRPPVQPEVLLENLLRNEDGVNVTAEHVTRPRAAGTRTPSPTPRSSSPRPG